MKRFRSFYLYFSFCCFFSFFDSFFSFFLNYTENFFRANTTTWTHWTSPSSRWKNPVLNFVKKFLTFFGLCLGPANRLFYLAVPPEMFEPATRHIRQQCMSRDGALTRGKSGNRLKILTRMIINFFLHFSSSYFCEREGKIDNPTYTFFLSLSKN